tara:strand:+ start:383 stop:514 length:132 start_codon:yes stop_codon:yes gene_type:complete
LLFKSRRREKKKKEQINAAATTTFRRIRAREFGKERVQKDDNY